MLPSSTSLTTMGEFFGEYIWRVQLQGNYIAIVEIEMRQAKIIEEEIQFFGSPKSVPCVVESVWMGGRWLINQWTGQESVQDTFSTNIRFGGSAKILCEWRQVAYLAPLMLILLGPALLATLRLGFSVNLLIHSFIHSVKGPVDQLYARIHYDGHSNGWYDGFFEP